MRLCLPYYVVGQYIIDYTEWLNESKAHDRYNNISWQEIDGDTLEYILLSMCCIAVSSSSSYIYI